MTPGTAPAVDGGGPGGAMDARTTAEQGQRPGIVAKGPAVGAPSRCAEGYREVWPPRHSPNTNCGALHRVRPGGARRSLRRSSSPPASPVMGGGGRKRCVIARGGRSPDRRTELYGDPLPDPGKIPHLRRPIEWRLARRPDEPFRTRACDRRGRRRDEGPWTPAATQRRADLVEPIWRAVVQRTLGPETGLHWQRARPCEGLPDLFTISVLPGGPPSRLDVERGPRDRRRWRPPSGFPHRGSAPGSMGDLPGLCGGHGGEGEPLLQDQGISRIARRRAAYFRERSAMRPTPDGFPMQTIVQRPPIDDPGCLQDPEREITGLFQSGTRDGVSPAYNRVSPCERSGKMRVQSQPSSRFRWT